jgi:ubiquinone/menaquinone biosynthesis C-methylase UbiE
MARETSKCERLRQSRGDFQNFLRGNGIDIGCGPDPLKVPEGTVRPWDLKDGDAQLMAGVPDGQLDFVYSSHCLEHMRDVRESLVNWIRILKPGGHLYVVIPDYILYEKMTWPSMYNSDHKQSFSFLIPRNAVRRPNHFHVEQDLVPMLKELGAEPVRVTMEDYGFNYNAGVFDQTQHNAVAQICIVARKNA